MGFIRVLGEARELSEQEATTPVVVARIDKTEAASLLKLLSAAVPLQLFQLEHLKRIRHSRRGTQAAGIDDDDDDDRLEIVVCPGRFLQQLPGEAARRLGPTREALVPRFAPSSREEFTAWGAYWPLNYRPRGQEGPPERVSEQDAALFASKRAALRREDAAMRALSGAPGMGALMVNPANDAVVATSSSGVESLAAALGGRDRALRHPLLTPAVLCIDAVAATMRAGVTDMSRALPMDQYLCTGLDLYVSREPDAMSCMALVHSRVRRVVFWERDAAAGCLGSRAEIHLIKSLNHHYEVYMCTEEEPGSSSDTAAAPDAARETAPV